MSDQTTSLQLPAHYATLIPGVEDAETLTAWRRPDRLRQISLEEMHDLGQKMAAQVAKLMAEKRLRCSFRYGEGSYLDYAEMVDMAFESDPPDIRRDIRGTLLWLSSRLHSTTLEFSKYVMWTRFLLTQHVLSLAIEEEISPESIVELLKVHGAKIEMSLNAVDPVEFLIGTGMHTYVVSNPGFAPFLEEAGFIKKKIVEETAAELFAVLGRSDDQPRPSPTHLVLQSPPHEGNDRDMSAILDRYAALSQPMPLSSMPCPEAVRDALLAEFPWFGDAIETVYGELALARRLGRRAFGLAPLLLAGPSGIGKSRFARRLADLSGSPCAQISAAGSADNRALAGTSRGYASTQPCLPLVIMARDGAANPVLIVEEIDKTAGTNSNGRIIDTLLLYTERGTASRIYDECLMTSADISRCVWILTANRLDLVDPLLRGRCTIIELGRPGAEHFDTLLKGCLDDIADEFECKLAELPDLAPEIVEEMREGFAAGRLQARQMRALVRKALVGSALAERAARN